MNLIKREKLIEEKKHLMKLKKWFSFDFTHGIFSVLLLIAILVTFLYSGAFVLIIMAVGFTPLLVRELLASRKKNWLFSFVIVMIVCFGLSWIPFTNVIINTMFNYFPLLGFFVVCWLLKNKIGARLIEIEWELEEEKLAGE